MQNPDETLWGCIWCGRGYSVEGDAANKLFCPSCDDNLPDLPKGDARWQWIASQYPTRPPGAQVFGHKLSDPWPKGFPIRPSKDDRWHHPGKKLPAGR